MGCARWSIPGAGCRAPAGLGTLSRPISAFGSIVPPAVRGDIKIDRRSAYETLLSDPVAGCRNGRGAEPRESVPRSKSGNARSQVYREHETGRTAVRSPNRGGHPRLRARDAGEGLIGHRAMQESAVSLPAGFSDCGPQPAGPAHEPGGNHDSRRQDSGSQPARGPAEARIPGPVAKPDFRPEAAGQSQEFEDALSFEQPDRRFEPAGEPHQAAE